MFLIQKISTIDVIGWTCVAVFISTSVITLLSSTKKIRLANQSYLKKLFYWSQK